MSSTQDRRHPRELAGDLAGRVRRRGGDLRLLLRGVRDLHTRIDALEAELQENRQLNRRITELLDVTTELLIPIADRDQDRVEEVLATYRASI